MFRRAAGMKHMCPFGGWNGGNFEIFESRCRHHRDLFPITNPPGRNSAPLAKTPVNRIARELMLEKF